MNEVDAGRDRATPWHRLDMMTRKNKSSSAASWHRLDMKTTSLSPLSLRATVREPQEEEEKREPRGGQATD